MGGKNLRLRMVVCLRCQTLKRHEARALCKCCYNHVREGRVPGVTLEMFPRLGWGGECTGFADKTHAEIIRRTYDPGRISAYRNRTYFTTPADPTKPTRNTYRLGQTP